MRRHIVLVGLFFFFATIFLYPVPSLKAETVQSDQLTGDKIKVIVVFDGEIKSEIVEKYGEVLKIVKIINGVIAIINKADVELLRAEVGVKSVVPDVKIGGLEVECRTANIEYRAHLREVYRLCSEMRRRKLLTLMRTLSSQLAKKQIVRGQYAMLLRDGLAAINIETLQLLESEIGIVVGWNLKEAGIAAEDTWNAYSLNGAGSIIAILDTGVNYNLDDLAAPNYLGGYDFINDDADPMDDNYDPSAGSYGHGTLVATIAVAQGKKSIKGVAPAASYYALKVLASDGYGDASNAIEALDWCVNTANPKPDIINMSLAFDHVTNPAWPLIEPVMRAAVDAAYEAGIILVGGSGNDSYGFSIYPAAFENVISAGAYAENQTLASFSNGGVDVVAPGKRVPSMDMIGDASYYYSGTSFSSSHVAGLAALVLQYARNNKLTINNGYQWESMKHSALDMSLITDPNFKGRGKARCKENIDIITLDWPLSYNFLYDGYAYIDGSGYPAYYIGTNMYQDITVTNNTDSVGGYDDSIENLDIKATQAYYQEHDEVPLPGSSTTTFPTQALIMSSDFVTVENSYFIPSNTYPGLDRTILDLSFEVSSDPYSHVAKIMYPYASIWCPPPVINEGYSGQ